MRFEQIGIVSWGEGCAKRCEDLECYPSVYSRVTYVTQWIKNMGITINQDCGKNAVSRSIWLNQNSDSWNSRQESEYRVPTFGHSSRYPSPAGPTFGNYRLPNPVPSHQPDSLQSYGPRPEHFSPSQDYQYPRFDSSWRRQPSYQSRPHRPDYGRY